MSISNAEYIAMLARRPLLAGNKEVASDSKSTSEKELHQLILDECRVRGWIAFHGSMAHATHRTIGEPDFIILCPFGRAMMVEVKTKTGKLRPEQLAIAAWSERLGHEYYVVRSMRGFMNAVHQRII
jgi:hypothetical protein